MIEKCSLVAEQKAEQRVKFSEENAEAASKKAEGAGKDDKKVGK